MPAGRPCEYDPKLCKKVLPLGAKGMGKTEMARSLGIHYQTFMDYQEKFPEFSIAVKEALRVSQAWWEEKGREATFGAHPGFNATSYIFQMKNRFGEDWRDRKEVDLNANIQTTKTIDPALLTDDERETLRAITHSVQQRMLAAPIEGEYSEVEEDGDD